MIIGLDVGGTHTDTVLIGPEGLLAEAKVPTNPADLFQTLFDGLEQVTREVRTDQIQRVVLSTTLATNLVVQRKLPAVGMVVAGGPGLDPAWFQTNEDYHVIDGALDHRGREIVPLDVHRLEDIAAGFKTRGIRHVGVVSKFSVRNPDHEKRMAEILAPHFDRVFMGHAFSGALNFPRRITTTFLNAAVYPVHKAFFEAVQDSLARRGLLVPIRLLKPDGGNMNFNASMDYPAQTILSGPAASVMGALAYAPKDSVSLLMDIGGTTTDMAVMVDGVPLLAPEGIEINTHKTAIRALLTHSIGVGGDSAVRVENGRLAIGPDRIGRAMAYGGPGPTPTDAFCILGLAEQGDPERSRQGLAPIAEALGVSVEQAAEQVFDTACEMILAAAEAMVARINSRPVYTVHEMVDGLQVRPKHLLILGGPAPQFAQRLQTRFKGAVSVVPHWQVANAIGCALARTTCEVSVFADTAQQMVTAPGEHFSRDIPHGFDLADARDLAFTLLREKALRRGANADHLQMEIIEESRFNMIRGFRTVGKNIRVRAQVKPGLIHGFDAANFRLYRDDL